MAIDLAAGRRHHLEVGADVELDLGRRDRRRLLDVQRHAPFLADLVVEAGLRVVRAGIPADAAADERTQRWLGDFPALKSRRPIKRTGLGVDILDEVDVLNKTPDVLHAEIAVVDEDEAALVRMDHEFLAVAFEHHKLRRRSCRSPRRRAAVPDDRTSACRYRCIERDHRCRIEIVARTRTLRLVVRSPTNRRAAPDSRCPTEWS